MQVVGLYSIARTNSSRGEQRFSVACNMAVLRRTNCVQTHFIKSILNRQVAVATAPSLESPLGSRSTAREQRLKGPSLRAL